jgi:hypothetical protein
MSVVMMCILSCRHNDWSTSGRHARALLAGDNPESRDAVQGVPGEVA